MLSLFDKYPGIEYLERFLINRQVGGFNGRINKKPDSCYTFWVGGALQVLGKHSLLDVDSALAFLLECEKIHTGGFSKVPGNYPDILHSYMSVSGLSILGVEGVAPLVGVLGITQRAYSASPFSDGVLPGGSKLRD